jgi:DNA mismatch endonuclease (patch repair protein)
MTDKFNPIKRSEIMSKIHSSDTTPEIIVRKLLFNMGYRYRLQRRDLPGNPDIVLKKYETVIFVNGCFWHGCPTCKHAKIRPQNNADYWNRKLERTIKRDKENILSLKKLGWRVLVIWECETKKRNLSNLTQKLSFFLSSIV